MRRLDPYSILEIRIRSGVYPAGTWLATERQLAEELGVHRQAIRTAVAKLSDVGLLERRPGHRPVIRRSEAHSASRNTVALLMGADPVFRPFQQVLRGCERELGSLGYRMVFMDTLGRDDHHTHEVEMRALDSLIQHPLTGVIVWCQDPHGSLPRLERLRASGTALVTIDRVVPGLEADFVGVDNVRAAEHAVEHLWELGHRRIAFITQVLDVSTVVDREIGYRSALRHLGLDIDESIIFRLDPVVSTPEERYQAIARQLIGNPDRPTALFAINDMVAWRLLHTMTAAGIRVPQDIAIVGFDDIEAWAMHRPVLTTVRQPYEGMGRHAANLLLQRLKAPDAPVRHLLLDTSLAVRSTTVAGADDVQTTLRSAWPPAVSMPQTAGVSTALR